MPNTSSQVPEVLKPAACPHLAKLRDQGVLVLLKVVHQLLGHLPGKALIGHGRVVAGDGMHAHFVLDLDHDDRVLPAIHFLDVPHQGRKGAGIGVPVGLAEGAELFDALAPFELGAREPLEIPLHPVGRVAGQAVLPASEPEQHETQVVLPRALDHAVQHAEVELAFLWFDLVPGNARQDGVEICLRDEPRPYRVSCSRGWWRCCCSILRPAPGTACHPRSVGWPCPASASEGCPKQERLRPVALALTRNEGERARESGTEQKFEVS